jgi:hypothetical protein
MDKNFEKMEKIFDEFLSDEERIHLINEVNSNKERAEFFAGYSFVREKLAESDFQLNAPVNLKDKVIAGALENSSNSGRTVPGVYGIVSILLFIAVLVVSFLDNPNKNVIVKSEKLSAGKEEVYKNKPGFTELADNNQNLLKKHKNLVPKWNADVLLHSEKKIDLNDDIMTVKNKKNIRKIGQGKSFTENGYAPVNNYQNNIFRENEHNPQIPDVKIPSGWSINFSRHVSLFESNQRVATPESYQAFDKLNISVGYQLTGNWQTGAGITGERFNLEYLVSEPAGDYTYYQTPGYITLQGFLEYNFDPMGNWQPLLAGHIGGNRTGVVGRLSAGLNYKFYDNFGIGVNLQYSNLFYRKDKLYNSGKLGINAGVVWTP